MRLTFAPLAAGRAFLIVGPHVWTVDADAAQAIARARKLYGRAAGWRYLVYDAPANATVDGMGYICTDADAMPARLIVTVGGAER